MKLIEPLVSSTPHATSSKRPDPLQARRLGEIVEGQAFALEVALDRLPVLDDDDRLAVEYRPQSREAEVEERDADLKYRNRHDREHRSGQRVVVLRQPLLHGVAEDDEEDQVERLELRELAATDHAHQDVERKEDEDAAQDDVHYGNTTISRSMWMSRLLPS